MRNTVLLIITIAILFPSCRKDDPVMDKRGDIVSTKEIDTYSPAEIQEKLTERQFDVPFTLEYDVQGVKITYRTPDPDGNLVDASGGIFYPVKEGSLPIISFQHGTQTHHYLVPSQGITNSEASLAGAVAASMGYIVVAADYLGLGDSQIVQPYLLNATSASTVIDMLRAAKTYLSNNGIATDGNLYLTGYSQGGTVTMAAHHEIEKNYSKEFQVTAAAPLAGAYDLVLTIDSVLSWETYTEPVLIAQMMYSYDHYYKWNRLDEIFKEPYASLIPGCFEGNLMLDGINYKLTQTISDLMQEQFLLDYKAGNETELIQALENNSLLNYTPDAPVRFYHGGADMTAPIQNTLAAKAYYESNGKTNVEFFTLPGLNHEDASAPAIIAAMQWFLTLQGK